MGGAGGNLLLRYTGDSNSRSFIPFNGHILAEYYCGGMIFDHFDEIGSATTATDCTGNVVNEKLYYPFGEAWTGYALPNLGMHQEFAQLPDYDPETDQYNTANRHYSPMGRWLSPDPGGLKAAKLEDPQTWNLYAYVRNNPMTFVDPEGESIELTCSSSDADKCAGERQQELQALQQSVGKEAGSYLYENPVTTTDANGNSTTKYYVGVYTNGPGGNGPAFDQINSVAGELSPIINDTKNVQLAIAQPGQTLTDILGNSTTLSGRNPGVTGIFGGNLRTYLVDSSTPLQQLPGIMMSNGQPGAVTPGTVVGHELGHARGVMTGGMFNQTNGSALRIEDKIRMRDNPNAPLRMIHDCPPGACQ